MLRADRRARPTPRSARARTTAGERKADHTTTSGTFRIEKKGLVAVSGLSLRVIMAHDFGDAFVLRHGGNSTDECGQL